VGDVLPETFMSDDYDLRLPELGDLSPVSLSEGGGDRYLLALAYYEQEGGWAANGVILLAMARTAEQLVERLRPHVRLAVRATHDEDFGLPVQVLREASETAYLGKFTLPNHVNPFAGDLGVAMRVLDLSPEDVVCLDLGNVDDLLKARRVENRTDAAFRR
jgi:hypothetical protein